MPNTQAFFQRGKCSFMIDNSLRLDSYPLLRAVSFRLVSALLSACVVLLTILAGCGKKTDQNGHPDISSRKIRVVCTIGMIADIAAVVGGDRTDVTGLMGPGVDPHLYKASAGDVRLLSGADIIFYNGLHLEGAMVEVLEEMSRRIQSVAVASGIPESLLISPPAFKGLHDPHVWFDVTLWMRAVEAVKDTYIDFDSANAELYSANADAYLDKLKELDSYVHERAEMLPEPQRVLVTAHDAFNYFGRQYGFVVRGLQGISTASEAGTGDIQKLADFITARKIRAVFIESSVPRRNIEAVQAAVKSRGFDVAIGGELFSDAMGDPGTPEGTYIGMVRHNIDTIVAALLGES
jgi:manganese/zinc/iron transport system substrate-binding protein